MRIEGSSGNVGIGTSSPSQKLHVVSTTNQQGVLVSGSVDNVALNLTNSGASGKTWGIYSTNTDSGAGGGALAFFDGTAYRAVIDTNGNLLVGTTSKLGGGLSGIDVNATNFSSVTFGIAGANKGYLYANNTSTRMQLESISGYTIAVVSGATGGVSLANGATSWAALSDERQKDIIEPIVNASEKVVSLRAVIGKYKTDDEGTRRSFLIAQDVDAVLPEAVDKTDQENWSLRYTEVVPLLVAAIQEQQALIQDLTTRLTTLEGN
jgi:hypothetical protein